jgi:predicted phage terminase large subunit-like protein
MALVDIMGLKIDPDIMRRELERVDCEDSLYLFLRTAWKYIDSAPWTDGWPIEAVAEHLQAVCDGDIKRLIVNIPPRMSKSSLTSVALPAWTWARRSESSTSGPGVQFLHASYSQQLSLRDSVKCRRLIESPWYQKYWGDRFRLTSDQNTKTRFDNNRSGSRLCTSVGSTLTGEGGNIIIVDDPNAAQEAFSEATINTTIEWWDTALSTRLNNAREGAFIIIQQRLAENDLTGHILSKDVGDWTHLMLPMRYEMERHTHTVIGWHDPRGVSDEGVPLVAILPDGMRVPSSAAAADILRDREGELLWPERFGESEVAQLERTLGPFAAAGQLQQRPEVKGGGIIKRDWWQLWESETNDLPMCDYIVGSLDTSYTEKQENDPSAMTIWGVFSGDSNSYVDNIASNRRGLININDNAQRFDEAAQVKFKLASSHYSAPKVILLYAWEEWLEFPELVEKVGQTARKFKLDRLLIENKAAGHSVAQEIRRLFNSADFAVQLVDPKGVDKRSRVYAIQHMFSEGLIYAPDRKWAEKVIVQTGMFPKAKHDDLTDTMSMALSHLRSTGMLQRSEEITHSVTESMRHQGSPPQPLYPV